MPYNVMILKRYVNCIIGIEIITRNIARLYDKVIFMASLCMEKSNSMSFLLRLENIKKKKLKICFGDMIDNIQILL